MIQTSLIVVIDTKSFKNDRNRRLRRALYPSFHMTSQHQDSPLAALSHMQDTNAPSRMLIHTRQNARREHEGHCLPVSNREDCWSEELFRCCFISSVIASMKILSGYELLQHETSSDLVPSLVGIRGDPQLTSHESQEILRSVEMLLRECHRTTSMMISIFFPYLTTSSSRP